jgi:hypothetical protein
MGVAGRLPQCIQLLVAHQTVNDLCWTAVYVCLGNTSLLLSTSSTVVSSASKGFGCSVWQTLPLEDLTPVVAQACGGGGGGGGTVLWCSSSLDGARVCGMHWRGGLMALGICMLFPARRAVQSQWPLSCSPGRVHCLQVSARSAASIFTQSCKLLLLFCFLVTKAACCPA